VGRKAGRRYRLLAAHAGDDLFLAGGNRLYRFDLTLPAEPLLLDERVLADGAVVSALATRDELVFVASNAGLNIYRRLADPRTTPESSRRVPNRPQAG
jgi:hypothetical protein